MYKTITYRVKNQYGTDREFITDDCKGDAAIIQQLTGQKTINSIVRELIRDLTNGQIQFKQVI